MEPLQKPNRGLASPSAAWQFALLFTSTVCYVVIVLYALAAENAEGASNDGKSLNGWLKISVGTTLTVVRVLQGILSAACFVSVARALLFLQWTLIQRPEGLSYRSLLALSPSTLDSGVFKILFSGSSGIWTRLKCLIRLLAIAFVWASGLFLFVRTSLITVFDTAESYNVVAGVGPFDGSLVNSFFDSLKKTAPTYPFTILPFSYYSVVWNLLANPVYTTVIDPIACKPVPGSLECASYLMSGGLALMAPWPGGFTDYPLVFAQNVPAVQLEFQGRSGGMTGDCRVLGSKNTLIAAEVCIEKVGASTIYAGLFICAKGVAGCNNGEPRANLTSSVTFYKRHANLIISRSNTTITGVSGLTEPQPVTDIDLDRYKSVLYWLLDYDAAGIPGPSSIIEPFFSIKENLGNPFIDGVVLESFRSVLAFPVWLFNPNNGGNIELESQVISPNLPKEFYTRASTVAPYVKLKFDPVFLLLFVIFQGTVLALLWLLLLWAFFTAGTLPVISSYAQFDISFKAEVGGPLGVEVDPFDTRVAGDSKILKMMDGVKVKSVPRIGAVGVTSRVGGE